MAGKVNGKESVTDNFPEDAPETFLQAAPDDLPDAFTEDVHNKKDSDNATIIILCRPQATGSLPAT
jgi:hypothetical protein